MLDFVSPQEAKALPNERLLGSSEVLASLFGQFKRLEQEPAKSGFTGLVLGGAAMVSSTASQVAQNALETVPTKTVLAWRQDNLGLSVQAQRRQAFASDQHTEQKRDPLRTPI